MTWAKEYDASEVIEKEVDLGNVGFSGPIFTRAANAKLYVYEKLPFQDSSAIKVFVFL